MKRRYFLGAAAGVVLARRAWAEEITQAQPELPKEKLVIVTRDGQRHEFNVEMALTVEIGRTQLDVLRRLHRELDQEIGAITAGGVVCSLTLGRMKREKLALKDRIARIEDAITPDIIA